MENLIKNRPQSLPFAHLLKKAVSIIEEKDVEMLCVKLKNFLIMAVVMFVVSSVLFATDSFAAENTGLFSDLIAKGGSIFSGMREIIYAVAGFGVAAVAIGGFFGNLNWKWLAAIAIGLFVIATTGAIINYMVGDKTITDDMIRDTLITGNQDNLNK
ncbi:MAG: TrbC/VirB2 family protein [Alphaproteobacteria bacterium]|nr:TrbC/VirB2 family protein [Alphaproteobacteria bacterium]